MLKSYEAVYDNGQLKWLGEKPTITAARIIVTVLEEPISDIELNPVKRRRFPPTSIAGKGKTIGDIVSPIVAEEDWECLK